MNRGVATTGRATCVSLDASPVIADYISFRQWQAQLHNTDSAPRQALHALVRELFEQLEPNERAVLRGVHLEGKSTRAVALSIGLHHSVAGRLRLKAENKLRDALTVAIRLQELEQEYSWGEW